MPRGKVEEYDSLKGCGSIIDSDTGLKLIVYANYITLENDGNLLKGQEVEYEINNHRKRRLAVNVRIFKKS